MTRIETYDIYLTGWDIERSFKTGKLIYPTITSDKLGDTGAYLEACEKGFQINTVYGVQEKNNDVMVLANGEVIKTFLEMTSWEKSRFPNEKTQACVLDKNVRIVVLRYECRDMAQAWVSNMKAVGILK